MILERASLTHQEELTHFFEQFSLSSIIDMKVRRPQGFFAPYKTLSDHYDTLILRDKNRKIQGTASLIFRDSIFEGQKQKIAFATDLRIEPSRKAILAWADHFLPTLRNTLQEQGVTSVFSIINTQDQAAVNTFVRPRSMKRAMPRYYLYRKFQMVSIHGRFPWAPEPVKGLTIQRAENRHLGPLLEYICNRAQYRAFSTVWDDHSFFDRLSRMKGLSIQDFWIAFDSREKIVGCLAPWSLGDLQEYCPLSYGLRAHNFRQFLKFGKFLGWTHPLTKPLSRTGEEAPLKFKILTNLYVDNEDVFDSLVGAAFDHSAKDEFLIYTHCNLDIRLNPPQGWVTASHPYGLYAVVPPEVEIPSFLHPSHRLNPEIEASMVF